MKSVFLLFACLFIGNIVCAQKGKDTVATKRILDSINRLVDMAVVKKEMATLQKYYADDFYFLHATGKVDNKASWMKSVSNPNTQTLSREHDSVQVELHDDVALLSGTLSVRFPSGTRAGYAIRYIRVYAFRKEDWQLLSHRSSIQWTLTN
jgi:ketosteroid isomerase-like protein